MSKKLKTETYYDDIFSSALIFPKELHWDRRKQITIQKIPTQGTWKEMRNDSGIECHTSIYCISSPHSQSLYNSFLCSTFCVINNISLDLLSQIQLLYGRQSVCRCLIVFSAHSLQQQSFTAFSINCICPAGLSFCSICVCLIGPVNCEAKGNVQMFILVLMCCVCVHVCVVSGHIQCRDGSSGSGLVMRSISTTCKKRFSGTFHLISSNLISQEILTMLQGRNLV